MVRFTKGDLLKADVDALVNTVNTKGVMGKGVALQFRNAFPANYEAYRRACKQGEVRLGRVFVFDNGQLARPYYIVNFPTKDHWRSKSRLNDIVTGLEDLVRVIQDLAIKSVALPPLGCGNGGLAWRDVGPLIQGSLAGLRDVDVLVFSPGGAPNPLAMPVRTPKPSMTPGRAALIGLLHRYAEPTVGTTPLEIQKLMYLLQLAGEPLRLKFAKGHYGPYAESVNHVLQAVEGHYLRGYGDRTQRVAEATPVQVMDGAPAMAVAYLRDRPATNERIERVVQLIEGFESPYGLELLTTVHYVASVIDPRAIDDPLRVLPVVSEWNRRKGRLFTPRHVEVAWRRLKDLGWLGKASLVQAT
ncbi:MAG: Appr-1-p processing protein [Actinobacteria bacterium]|nr:Appr-1-p processing protein [Actinomycetota bacterium]